MKRELMEILCCPVCKGNVTLTVTDEDDWDGITSGKIHCEKCNVDYPIEDGVPNMLPQNIK